MTWRTTSAGQSISIKKNPKVSAKTVRQSYFRSYARAIYIAGTKLFCPDNKGTKQFYNSGNRSLSGCWNRARYPLTLISTDRYPLTLISTEKHQIYVGTRYKICSSTHASETVIDLHHGQPGGFIVLLTYTCSALLLLPWGEIWGSHTHSLHQNRSSLAKHAGSLSPCRVWHTQHYKNAISIAQKTRSWRHVCFKSLVITMPTTTTLALSFTSGMAKSGTILASDPSVDMSVPSLSTGGDGLIPQDGQTCSPL